MVILLTLLFGCGDTAREQAILDLTGDVAAGATLYAGNCATCHAADGTGGSGPDLVAAQPSSDKVVSLVLYGEDAMPSFADLSDQEIADIVAFVEAL